MLKCAAENLGLEPKFKAAAGNDSVIIQKTEP
jgi:hypothetical protein